MTPYFGRDGLGYVVSCFGIDFPNETLIWIFKMCCWQCDQGKRSWYDCDLGMMVEAGRWLMLHLCEYFLIDRRELCLIYHIGVLHIDVNWILDIYVSLRIVLQEDVVFIDLWSLSVYNMGFVIVSTVVFPVGLCFPNSQINITLTFPRSRMHIFDL